MTTNINLDEQTKSYLSILGYSLFQKACKGTSISDKEFASRLEQIKNRYKNMDIIKFKIVIEECKIQEEEKKIRAEQFGTTFKTYKICEAYPDTLVGLDILSEISEIPDDILQHTLLDYIDLEKETVYWDNGNIKYEYNYAFGQQHGIQKINFQNGTIFEISNYNQGIITSTDRYSDKGVLNESSEYLNNIKYTKRFYWDGTLSSTQEYILNKKNNNGIVHGKVIKYFENGKIRETQIYNYGKLDGEWNFYYKNGKIRETQTYKNGHQEGQSYKYNENGNLYISSEYIKGIKHGKEIIYSEEGTINNITFYNQGLKNI